MTPCAVLTDGPGQLLAVGHPYDDGAAGQSAEVDTDDVLLGGTGGHERAFLTNVSGHNSGRRRERGQGADPSWAVEEADERCLRSEALHWPAGPHAVA